MRTVHDNKHTLYLVKFQAEFLVLLLESQLFFLKLLTFLLQTLVEFHHAAVAAAGQLQLQIIVL